MYTQRQQEILNTALELINKKGIQGLTIKNLSKKIGISEPAIYRHFENKIEILSAVLSLFQHNSSQIFKEELAEQHSATAKISMLFKSHFKLIAATPALSAVIFSEEIFRNEPQLVNKITEIIERNQQMVAEIIVQGQKAGEIKNNIDAKNLSTIVLGTLRLFVKNWQFSAFSFDLEHEGEKVIDDILKLIE